MSTVSSLETDDKPKGCVLFTGPDGIGDYKVLVEEQFYIGHGTASSEASSDTSYLYRGAKGAPHPVSKGGRVGEVGWGIPCNTDYSLLKSGHQIMLKEFRKAAEDRYTHRHQTPYYDPPNHQSMNQQQCTILQMEGAESFGEISQTKSDSKDL